MLRIYSLVILTAMAWAQAPQALPTAAEARVLEDGLKANPGDRAARGRLLEYYFRNPSAEAIPVRRAHILWFIRNAPDDPVAGRPSATIDAAGHRLADAQGYAEASAAWRQQAANPNAATQTLLNAAYFFKLSDRTLTASLLERAMAKEPLNPEAGARLGDHYAAMILGITMVNGNGFPTGVDPALAQSASALQARTALQTSRNPYLLAKAGYMLSFQGSILRASRQLAFDPAPLAEAALERAVSLAPSDPGVAYYREQHRAIQAAAKGR